MAAGVEGAGVIATDACDIDSRWHRENFSVGTLRRNYGSVMPLRY
jgi:hypothetical protein